MGPLGLIGLGVSLLLLGAALPFLMVLRVLSSSFALNFLAYTFTLVGLILGLFGLAQRAFLRGRGRGRR